jgi:hypothetical protein
MKIGAYCPLIISSGNNGLVPALHIECESASHEEIPAFVGMTKRK